MAYRGPLFLLTLAVVSAAHAPGAAHNGDRVFPIRYLSEETLALLDQNDGTVEDWVDALGEPTLTPLDFNLVSGFDISYDQHDPGSLDFRIWMGWTPDGRIHVAGLFVDDVYVNEYDPQMGYPFDLLHVHDNVGLLVDGDHTGGKYSWHQSNSGHFEEAVQTNRQAQHYRNIATAPSGPTISLPGTSEGAYGFDETGNSRVDWMVQPPFARGGGGVFSENPTIWVTEFYVTCFDLLDHLNPQNSVVSGLDAGKTIGFNFGVSDNDEKPAGRAAYYDLVYSEEISEVAIGADSFVDGLLLGPDDDFGNSAVQSASWARIKASLEPDLRNHHLIPEND